MLLDIFFSSSSSLIFFYRKGGLMLKLDLLSHRIVEGPTSYVND